MPLALVRSISLPNLKIYTTISLLLVSGCIYYSFNVVKNDPNWKLQHNTTGVPSLINQQTNHQSSLLKSSSDAVVSILTASQSTSETTNSIESDTETIASASDVEINNNINSVNHNENVLFENLAASVNETRTFTTHLKDTFSFMSQEPICIWTLINMAYCCLILLGKSIQKIVFGELRISEQQHMKDKFWNFIFYKFIFVFGVVNVQYLHEVVLWVSWFSALGFLHLLSQLCKDRFEYLSFSPTTPGWSHFRLIALLSSIFTISGFMIIISIFVGLFSGINTFAFMAAECFILAIRTLHVLIRYGMFLYDMRQGAINSESAVSWDKRGSLAYYTEFGFDLAALLVDLFHHLHMLLWSNIFLSMASLVIIMQLRYLTNEIQRKFKKHRNYLWVLNHMEKSYPLATAEDLSQNSDNCAICWEKMETARKLPCGHLFHNSCLQSWLEQDTSCPTCRLALSVQSSNQPPSRQNPINLDDLDQIAGAAVGGNVVGPAAGIGTVRNNHFFHFNGSRYVSWLPNFSVEVSNINNVLRNGQLTATINHLQQQQQTSQLRNMARHIQEMFPRYPISTLMADLQITHSIELTIDNILEDRLPVPRNAFDDLDETEGGSNNNSNNSNRASYPAATASDYYINADDFTSNSATITTPTTSSSQATSASSVATTPSPSSSSDPLQIQNNLNRAYEIEQNATPSIFGNQADLLRDDSVESHPDDDYGAAGSSSSLSASPTSLSSAFSATTLGDRFSKSSQEREKILQRRKEQIIMLARKRYLEKTKSELNMPTDESELRHRSRNRDSEL